MGAPDEEDGDADEDDLTDGPGADGSDTDGTDTDESDVLDPPVPAHDPTEPTSRSRSMADETEPTLVLERRSACRRLLPNRGLIA